MAFGCGLLSSIPMRRPRLIIQECSMKKTKDFSLIDKNASSMGLLTPPRVRVKTAPRISDNLDFDKLGE